MSRTYKDRPIKLQWPDSRWDWDMEKIPVEWPRRFYNVEPGHFEETDVVYTRYVYLKKAGVKTKKKRNHEDWNWMSTPMWWIREMMNQPQRARGHQWERSVVNMSKDELEDCDPPGVSRKPHIYYW